MLDYAKCVQVSTREKPFQTLSTLNDEATPLLADLTFRIALACCHVLSMNTIFFAFTFLKPSATLGPCLDEMRQDRSRAF